MKRLMLSVVISPVIFLSACWWDDGEGTRYGLGLSKPLNDTGITFCADYAFPDATHNAVNCAVMGATQTVEGVETANGLDPVPAGQDAVFGRDVTDNSHADGYKGFSFTRLGSSGAELAIQNGTYSDLGLEGIGTKWSCVRDEVTGLVWEVKTNDIIPGLRDKDWTYTWYNSNSAKNGGNAGTQDTGSGMGSADNCYLSSRCDTEKYIADINSAYLCGANNWRLPSHDELKTLRHFGTSSPAIEGDYFPNTQSGYFWSASTRAADVAYVWRTDFDTGAESVGAKTSVNYVRLVRDDI